LSTIAVVDTKRSSLKVYSVASARDTNLIGTLEKGTTVTIEETKVINNIQWARITSDTYSGWVIQQHPSLSYAYLKVASTSRRAAARAASTTSSSTTTVSSKATGGDNNPSSDSYVAVARTTSGMASNIVTEQTGNTVEVTPGKLESFDKLERSSYYLSDALQDLRRSVNIITGSVDSLVAKNSTLYNRFKVPVPDIALAKTFGHVFFTRPDCNILNYLGSNTYELTKTVANNSDFKLEFKNRKELLMQLCSTVGFDHDFMMLPSNQVTSFETRDRSLNTDVYGRNFYGYTIAYGKTIDSSVAASDVSISFSEDKNLSILRLHQLWINYIDGVKKGVYRPNDNHLFNKELDYAASCYYILCGENGEDIIYWAKLYGIFPTNVPDSVLSWTKGEQLSNPSMSITYQYSWKRDNEVELITEFNANSEVGTGFTYEKTYNDEFFGTGNTWVGAPFIESVTENGKLVYKLRFRPE
jgi:hypothetical protein